MEQWEYLTQFLTANAKTREARAFIKQRFGKDARAHSPESLIPQLDKLGAEGWELVHMEPIAKVGGKEDVRVNAANDWSSTYFCVFKRRKAGTALPIQVMAVQRPGDV